MHPLALRDARPTEPRPLAPPRRRLRVVSGRHGLDRAQAALVAAHRPLVLSMARKHGGQGAWLDDLIQEGSLGLIKAAGHFDPRKGTSFGTYAKWWVRAYLNRCPPDGAGGDRERSAPELLADETVDLERQYARSERDREVRAALQKIKRRLGNLGWEIVQERLCKEPPDTLDEIARRWSLSRERVRQIELRTKALLARQLQPLLQ
jgi:RNA polymerase primary sigma factor